MNMVLPSLSGGANALTSTAGTSASASGGASTAVPFAQTLIQSMGGEAGKGTDNPVLGDLATLLQGLMSAVQTTTAEDSGEQTSTADNALVDGLTQDLEKLDDSISSDPALLAALQGWIVQVSALLSGGAAESGTGNTDTADSTLSPLAQNPDTLRFAVQDELNSLVSLVQDATAAGDGETVAKGIALLNDFAEVLTQAQVPGTENKSKGKTAGSSDSPVSSLKYTIAQTTDPDTVNTDAQLQPATLAEADDAGTQLARTATAKSSADSGTEEGSSQEETFTLANNDADSNVVTAGQLSIQNGINTPLKAEKVQVPVHKFAQEMTNFIGGKLEIVNKEGSVEATISLFPENLGQVDVKITLQNGHLVAQFVTEHSGAKDILEQQMSQLRASLQSQGLQVERLEVTQNNTPLQSQFGQDSKQQGSGGQQSGKRSKKSDEDINEAILAAELSGEYNEWVTERLKAETIQGGKFSTQA